MNLSEITDQAEWDEFVNASPVGHPLQLWAWGELKRANGWRPVRLALVENGQIKAGAQMLFWPIPRVGQEIAYVPRGPVVSGGETERDELLARLALYARQHRALFLRIEPAWSGVKLLRDWRRSKDQTLLAKTYTIDLTMPESEISAAMRSKTRQYIRQAASNGVKIEEISGPIDDVWRIYVETALRAKFGLHRRVYYEHLHQLFGKRSRIFVAKKGDQTVAFLWLVEAAGTAFELYGGVTSQGAELKANYLLKNEAILGMKKSGNRIYDFNGRLHEGVSQFKAGFGGEETDFIGTYDRVFGRLGYVVWRGLQPLKPLGRKLIRRK